MITQEVMLSVFKFKGFSTSTLYLSNYMLFTVSWGREKVALSLG